jgi:serine/threonine protein kinase
VFLRVFARFSPRENSMEVPKSSEDSFEARDSVDEQKTVGGHVSLFVRVWSYGGPSHAPAGLRLEQDAEIAELIRDIVRESNGRIVDQQPELWCAHFDDALHAVTAAKSVQQRFLTFQRKTEPQQVVPSILIYPSNPEEVSGPEAAVPADMLANVTSAQILIAESIYEQMKSVPGFRFNSKVVRKAGETFGPEAIYEMLWTDESTYGHLRQASRAGLKTVGRYQIQEELGRGAMGAVHKAYDELIGRTVALKTISIDRNAPRREELIERLKQEAKAAGGLDHPNIITIYDVGQEDDVVYLSMQYVRGTTLASLLADSGVPSLAEFLSWADQICAAVGFAHASGVIHRDLKPANLMVTGEGVIKVLDFGIAKVEDTSLTQTGLVVGTPSYMSPEQLTGKKVDHRADIFALGSVFYELVTRERPFQGDVTTILYKIAHEEPTAPSLVNPAIPGGIDAVIRRALGKDPKERFQSCEEMRAALAEQGARLHLTPSVTGSGMSVIAATQTPTSRKFGETWGTPQVGTATPPSFLLVEPEPQRRSIWPVAFLLLFLGTAGWAFYIHQTTGSYPEFFNNLVSTSRESLQGKGNLPDQNPSSGKSELPASNNDGENVQPGTPQVSQPTGGDSEVAPPVSATGGGKAGASDDTGEASSPAPNEVPPPSTAVRPGSQPVTAVQPPGAAVPTERSPFSPVGTEEQSSGSTSAQVQNKPTRQAPLVVDGFTKKNVPELLRVAEIAAQRRDYRLARYEYNIILRLDHNNATARAGLRLVQEAERLR